MFPGGAVPRPLLSRLPYNYHLRSPAYLSRRRCAVGPVPNRPGQRWKRRIAPERNTANGIPLRDIYINILNNTFLNIPPEFTYSLRTFPKNRRLVRKKSRAMRQGKIRVQKMKTRTNENFRNIKWTEHPKTGDICQESRGRRTPLKIGRSSGPSGRLSEKSGKLRHGDPGAIPVQESAASTTCCDFYGMDGSDRILTSSQEMPYLPCRQLCGETPKFAGKEQVRLAPKRRNEYTIVRCHSTEESFGQRSPKPRKMTR